MTKRTPWSERYRPLGVLRRMLALAVLAVAIVLVLTRQLPTFSALHAVITSLAPLAVVPAAVALVVSGRRHRILAAVAAVTLIAASLPLLRIALPAPGNDAAPALRVVTANLLVGRGDLAAIEADVLAHDPDVIALQEIGDRERRWLYTAFGDYEHRFVFGGEATLSRLPLRSSDVTFITARSVITAVIETDAGPVQLLNVHTATPLFGGPDIWRSQLEDLRELALSLDPSDGPVMLAGDFNATPDHREFRRLASPPLADGASTQRAWIASWPDPSWPLPTMMRLDHVLTGPGLRTVTIDSFKLKGSDHRGVVADIATIS